MWLNVGFLYILTPLVLATKIWRPSAELNNIKNWGPSGLPKDCDRITLPQILGITVKLSPSSKTPITSITLPRNGVLQIPNMGFINFGATGQCGNGKGADRLMLNVLKEWYDPANWKQDHEKWVPHSLRVPCAGEPIIFPNNTAINVMLPPIIAPISTISVKGQVMNSEEWSNYLQTETGYENFPSSEEIRTLKWPQDKGCQTRKQCSCLRDAISLIDYPVIKVPSEIMIGLVCIFGRLQCETTEAPPCYNPINPVGHCCGVCGALLTITDDTKDGIPIENIRARVDIIASKYAKLKYHVGRLGTGDIQIVILSPDGDVTQSISVMDEITGSIPNDIGSPLKLALSYSGHSKEISYFGHASGIIFGTLACIAAFFASIYYIYVMLPNRKWLINRKSFNFARFHNTVDELAEDSVVLSTDSYDNPTYEPHASSSENPNATEKDEKEPSKDKSKERKLLTFPDCSTEDVVSFSTNADKKETISFDNGIKLTTIDKKDSDVEQLLDVNFDE